MSRLLVLIGLVVITTACGASIGAGPPSEPPPAAAGGGPGITIDEAVAYDGDQPLLVNGSLVIDPDGTVRLCSALAESFPPQCGGTSLVVEGLDLASLDAELQEGNGVRWTEGEVQILGTVEDGMIVVSSTSL